MHSANDGDATLKMDVVVPARNEGIFLPRLLSALDAALATVEDLTWRLIVVDDGSDDDSWSWIQARSVDDARLHGIRLARGFGKEAAIVAGLERCDADAVLVMDADLEHPPAVVPLMLDAFRVGQAAIVTASRRARSDETLGRRWGARVFYAAFRRATGLDLEYSSDFKLIERRVVDAYLALRERRKFFRGLTAWLGFKEARVEYEPVVALGKQSAWSLWRLLQYGVQSLVAFTSAPLLLVGLLGVGTLLFSLALGAQTLVRWWFGNAVEGFTTVILVQLVLGSVLMLGLAVIGTYLAMIYDEVKARPLFSVRETTGAAIRPDASS